MTELTQISPEQLQAKLKDTNFRLIDIREADEFAREHICDAVSMPLSSWNEASLEGLNGANLGFMCRSGQRTEAYCVSLEDRLTTAGFKLEGGLDGWKKAGFSVIINTKAPMEIQRQVHIIAGSLILSGALLANFVHPYFIGLSGLVGAGLLFSGLSGWCGMAKLLKGLGP